MPSAVFRSCQRDSQRSGRIAPCGFARDRPAAGSSSVSARTTATFTSRVASKPISRVPSHDPGSTGHWNTWPASPSTPKPSIPRPRRPHSASGLGSRRRAFVPSPFRPPPPHFKTRHNQTRCKISRPVAHLSSKLSHLAQSFRPQHHFNTLRNAFPSSASAHGGSTTGFFDPANVFQQAANNTLGAATGQAAGAGAGSSAGGAGGAKWHAGRNAYNWGSSVSKKNNNNATLLERQNPGRMMSQATSQDSSTRLDEEAEDSSSTRGRRNVLLTPHRAGRTAPAPFKPATRERSSSIPSSTERPAPPTELLNVSEMGLPAPRLSSSEMQSRYRFAFAQGTKTVEMVAMEREADEMDLGPQASSVRVSGRRASISSLTTPSLIRMPRPLLLAGSSSSAAAPLLSARGVHTTTKSSPSSRPTPFPSTSPPLATVARVRRNSTSAIESSSPSLLDAADAALQVPPPRQSSSRPPASSPNDPASMLLRKRSSGFKDKMKAPTIETIRNSSYRSPEAANDAVRHYVAVESAYSVEGHNAAMEALLRTRLPNTPITTIVHLYNQLFEHEALRPTRKSYELVLKTFCTRDQEVLNNISFLTKRIERKKGATLARGPYHRTSSSEELLMNPAEQRTLETLQKEDYLSPALEIYKTLGPLGDKLEDGVMSELIAGAARRGRIDLALTLFGRVERSPFQKALSGTYIALIQMFGREKDKESLMAVFEGYLQARATGQLRPTNSVIKRPFHQQVPVKHAYSTAPEFTLQANSGFFIGGDDAVWRNTIAALFEVGDSAEAVALLERMLLAQNSSEPLPAGYPTTFAPAMLATIVAGFASLGDENSARKWFDQAGAVASSGVPVELHGIAFHAALRADLPALLRHIYAASLDRAGPNFMLSISDFVTFVDTQIASLYASTTSAEDARAAIDAIVSARPKFEQAARKGWTLGNPQREVALSTGLLSRIVSAFAHCGDWTNAANTFVELGRTILRAQVSKDSVRSPEKWILVGRESAMTALGFVPQDAKDWTRNADAPRLPIAEVTKVVAMLNRFSLQAGTNETTPSAVQVLVVECFLSAKAENKGDVEALKLSGDQWYTIIDAFASVQSQIRRGLEPAFEFPGFEPIIDDFAASQVKIPSAFANNFPALVESLLAGGMPSDRARAVLAVLDLNLAQSLEAKEAPAPVEAPAAAAVAAAAAAQVEAPSPSVAQSARTYAAEPAPVVIPTPPATPPPHVLKHLSAPLPTVNAIDINLSNQLDTLIYGHNFDDAFKIALQAADQGRYAHPEALGRLLEALGRAGKTEAARQTYTLAYASLPALAAQPTDQSMAWSALEDHMIITLAVAGELEEVGQHRDRLIQAGSAPSADGYAAMILHMKETTNDAAVALTLFEESQRLGVKPNIYLFNTLISKLSRARRAKDALEYFELMKSHGLKPTAITYGAIINACCKTGDDASADYLFQEMIASPNFKPRVPPYNTMIQFYTSTKPDRARALHYYRALLNARVQPTGHTYKLLLDCYGSIDEPDFASMEDVFATLLQDPAVIVTGAHWASLIHSYGSVGKDLDKAVQIFDSIQGHASTLQSRSDLPDAVVYEALLNAFIANGRADLCENYLVEMKDRGVKMTAYVANTLIKGHAAQNNMSSARAVFDAMQDPPAGFAASGNHAVNRHPKQQQQQSSDPAASGPVYREPSTWETMIKVELEAGEAPRALGLMKRVEERAFPEAVVARIRKHLDDAGLVSLA
ncbi:BZ3500_MvSof-1268-A1-R1_Chr7-1g09257 [Microbotryum saponariae]|uniref:BZ3500_MvSof-1268-A1-R1_Chr7-1g09257 protein n=1 Tax=Microbotryum saponariae TaxID=289078 RepID=A0A2X0LDF4_9BASI|nr:BZ3501_MvSof-1269-A2-R1_Chr7-1g08962 [Microbotryum saponariae]SDA03100.1 BZ3500_MvSof-1268-A1-R1_Chr7-1g09257 [Microbotryum saponariae]